MLLPTATLEYPDAPSPPKGSGSAGSSLLPPPGKGMKFHYASGTRPLEGYAIKRGIGRGGFGEVYFAISDAGKEVALKRIERNLEVELRGVSQCINLRHNNLVELYDIRQDDNGETWVVMEYIAGPSLKEVLDRNPIGLTPDETLFWFRGLAAGVGCLHDHGIVHRDLKPGNLFDDGGVIKVGDYGLCKFISGGNKSGQTESVGTFHYMAPEIGKGDYGKEIDIYALGIVLFEILTGKLPFDGESSQEIIMKHLTADPDLSAVPAAFRAVIARALRKDATQRFSSVAEMLAAVEKAIEPAAEVVGASVLTPEILAATLNPPVQTENGAVLLAPPKPSKLAEPIFIGEHDEPGIELGPVLAGPGKPLPTSSAGRPRNGHVRPANGRPVTLPMAAAGTGAAVARPPLADEPIAAAVKTGFGKFVGWLNHGPGGMVVKVAVVLALIAGFAFASPVLIWPAMVLGALYLVYLGFRLMVQAASGVRVEPEVVTGSGRKRVSLEQQCRNVLGMKTAGDKLMELSGSMLGATAVTAILGVVMLVVSGKPLDLSIDTWTLYGWLVITSTLSAWLVLAAGKFWETTKGEGMKRRFGLLVLGLVLGLAAFGVQQMLFIRLPDEWASSGFQFFKQPANMISSGQPLLPMFLLYFGGLLAVVGWWKQVDPLRDSRLAVGPIVVTALLAWLWYGVWQFPQPWGIMVAVMTSAAVQLAAPWLSPATRQQIRERTV